MEWYGLPGREIRCPELEGAGRAGPLVACLNIWNDKPALQRTLPSWYDAVDQVLAIDGAYAGVPAPQAGSTDGTLEFLSQHRKVQLVRAHGFWSSQAAKRSMYFQLAPAGATLLVVDADEMLTGDLAALRRFEGDVGWVTVSSPMYQRRYGQPRLFRHQPGLRYVGRHHWVFACDRLVATHEHGGAGFLHCLIPGVTLEHARNLNRDRARRRASGVHRQAQHAAEAGTRPPAGPGILESLRILQLSTYDPGLVAYRFHTALNAGTPHASILGHRGTNNPFAGPLQYDTEQPQQLGLLRVAAQEADVAHLHLGWGTWDRLKLRRTIPTVVHHHGTIFRRDPAVAHAEDRRRGAVLRLVSNPELLKYRDAEDDLRWLPNPVPVAWYRRLAARWPRPDAGPFRVAHSPSKRHLKGTEDFLAACARLQARGVAIEPVVLDGAMAHAEVLRRKATCDASFDSFWLGLQCSGLEAAGMGQPVIAGDPDVAAYLKDLTGAIPYTYANDGAALERALEQLAIDPAFYAGERARLKRFVVTWHDGPAVVTRYLDLLDAACCWRGTPREA